MGKIAYDRPVKDLIAGLNATGHVTHTKHRKTHVTLHHNGGRLSHEGVLNVWKTRPASAHLDVDAVGDVAQYVEAAEYAWACGSTEGNQKSISIEMANSTLAPEWGVAEATWRSAARLAGWLFARIIGARPTRETLVVHSHWKATICAGPYIAGVYNEILSLAQQSYDQFVGSSTPSQPPTPPVPSRKTNAQIASEVLDGKWGNNPERKNRLEAAGYNYAAVQAEVNRRLGGGAPSAHRPSVHEVAKAVIRGEWGNGVARRTRLEGAGYNYREVQNEVNRLL